MPCYRVIVRGKVQGVGYRAFAKAQADSLSLAGWCRNLPVGHVEITVKGAESEMAKFITALKKGPSKARVNVVSVEPAKDCDEYTKFEIKHK
ncbi:MAG: acylphosphatase [Candidatus Aenigmarchaeota archaeon]|nr:acylphosphatase [Candidatus Aenigmarchaeota archaeon]